MKENDEEEKLPLFKDILMSGNTNLNENFPLEIKNIIEEENKEPQIDNLIKEYKELLKEVDEIKKNGNLQYNQKNYSKATEYYNQGISKLNSFKTSNYTKNKLIIQLNNEVKSTLVSLYNNLALSLEMEKNYDEAINIYYNIIMNLDSENELAYKRILELSLNLNKIEIANYIAEKIKEKFRGTSKYNQYQKNLSLLDKINKDNKGGFWTSKIFIFGSVITLGVVLTYLYKKKWSK